MHLLVDTHALLWAVENKPKLSQPARLAISDENNVVFVSLASLWEIKIKESLGKIEVPKNFYKNLEPAGYELLPVTLQHIEALGKLPLHHRDPFDRMIVVQAQCEQLVLVTGDPEIKKYDVHYLSA